MPVVKLDFSLLANKLKDKTIHARKRIRKKYIKKHFHPISR